MNTRDTVEIRRFTDGSIDYGYYSALGQRARYREIRALARRVWNAPARPSRLLPAIAAIVAMLTF